MEPQSQNSSRKLHDLLQTSLAIAALGILGVGSFKVIEPFIGALVWAGMIVIATWPLMLKIQRILRDSRTLATFVMTAMLLLLLFVPLWISISTVVVNADTLRSWVTGAFSSDLPPAPNWLVKLPIVGKHVALQWEQIRFMDRAALGAQLAPYAADFGSWFFSQVGSFGLLFVHFLLTVIISGALYLNGETISRGLLRFADRLAGAQGTHATTLAARAIRAVALGIVVTALVQSVVAALGLLAAGIPYLPILVALIFIFGVAQVGPVPVMGPTIVWLYWSEQPGWGTAMLLWTVLLIVIDNALRPALIRRGADLPIVLVFVGVMGGLFAYGIIGLFVGPVVLAVTYTLLSAWVNQSREQNISTDSTPLPT